MIDFHTHILPNVDDGPKTIEESLEILKTLEELNIDTVCLTPHYYASRKTPERFIEKRNKAYEELKEAYSGNIKFLLGSEVCYYSGISNLKEITSLRLEGTKLLLLEMPSVPWNNLVINEVLSLNARDDIQVVLAHIERYIDFQKKETLDLLIRSQVLFQSNLSFFYGIFRRKKALKMLNNISFIASDVHNKETLAKDKKVLDYLNKHGLENIVKKEKEILYESKI